MKDLTDYYATVGFFRGQGFDEAHAYHHAHELMEVPMGLNEFHMQNILSEALELYADDAGTEIKTRTYEEAGLLTRDNGLIVEVEGSTFQLTIVKA